MRQPAWNKYEVSLLIDAYIQIHDNGLSRRKVLENLSKDLRQMAQNNGLEIDDTYRNYNGMSWQYHFIEDLFQDKVTEGHSPSKLFTNMVDTYKSNRKEYERIVCKAKKMSAENSEKICTTKGRMGERMDVENQEISFYDWLKGKPKLKANPNSIMKVYRICSEYAYKHGISEKRFDDMTEPEEYLKVSGKLRSAYLFRVINRNTALLYDKTYRYFAEYLCFLKDIKASKSKKQDVETTVEIESGVISAGVADTHDYSEVLTILLSNHFAYGIRLNSDIEMSRLKKYAVNDGIVIPDDNELLRNELRWIGFISGDKLYTVSRDAIHTLKGYIEEIFSQSIDAVYYDKLMEYRYDWMEEQHATSSELLKAIIESHKSELFDDMPVHMSKTFFSFSGKQTERAAVTKEIKRVWGEEQLRTISELSERLTYIPESIIGRVISGNPEFVWNSEDEYLLSDRFVIEDEQAKQIIEFANSMCSANGFASLTDLPIEDLQEVYYELNLSCIYNAVFCKLLAENFSLNGKIIVKKGSKELDLVSLVKAYISDKQECTFDEAHAKVIELTGDSYRHATFVALYDTMVRVTKERFVADRYVHFDIDAIDSELSKLITDQFCAVREISTFALFPMCGQSWNHYLLESYCYRFSKKYSYFVMHFNDKNVGIIAEKGLNLSYKEMLIRVAARAKIELSPESIGRYFFETGYLGKSKHSWLEEITEKAQALREK